MRGLEGNFQAQPRVFAHDAVVIVPGAINNTAVDDGLTVTNSGTGYAVGDTVTLSTPAAGVVGDRAVVTVSKINAPAVTVLNDDLIGAATTNQTDFVDNSYTGTVGVTAGYSTSGAGTGLIITVTVSGNTATKVNVDSIGTGFVAGDTITVTGSGGILGGATGNLVLTIGKGSINTYNVTTVGAKYVSEPTPEAVTQAATSGSGSGFAASVVNNDVPNTQERGCCVYVGDISGGTNIKVTMESDNEVTFTGVVAGSFLPILVKKVFNSGTTASGLIALY